MINGAHSIIYSTNPDADRSFFRELLELPNVDVGGGWLIFGLPPAEVAVHPSDKNDVHELYLMCDDVNAFVAVATQRGVKCGPIQDQGWGILTHVVLPGGGKLGVYQPRHARPKAMRPATRKPSRNKSARPSKNRRGRSSRASKRSR